MTYKVLNHQNNNNIYYDQRENYKMSKGNICYCQMKLEVNPYMKPKND